MDRKKRSEIICRCNEIPKKQIEEAIVNGAHTEIEIFDQTTAGVGPCGGTCRVKLREMLKQYLETGTFPETFIGTKKKPRQRR